MKPYKLTPWARQKMTPELRDEIEQAIPAEYTVSLGRGTGGWACHIRTPESTLVGDAYGAPSVEEAFREARLNAGL